MGAIAKVSPPRPKNREGPRFFACPWYDRCLRHAAGLDWEYFTCSKCPNRGLERAYETARFVKPYYGVLEHIYPEFKARFQSLVDLFQEGC
jgi:hypothetical protein